MTTLLSRGLCSKDWGVDFIWSKRLTELCNLLGALSIMKFYLSIIFSACFSTKLYSSWGLIRSSGLIEIKLRTVALKISLYPLVLAQSTVRFSYQPQSNLLFLKSQIRALSSSVAEFKIVHPTANISAKILFSLSVSPLVILQNYSGARYTSSFSMAFSKALNSKGQVQRLATFTLPSSLRKMFPVLMSPTGNLCFDISKTALERVQRRYHRSVYQKRVFFPYRLQTSSDRRQGQQGKSIQVQLKVTIAVPRLPHMQFVEKVLVMGSKREDSYLLKICSFLYHLLQSSSSQVIWT